MMTLLRRLRTLRVLLAVVVLATLSGLAWCGVMVWDSYTPTNGEIRALVNRELPKGSSAEEIIAFLNEHHSAFTERRIADEHDQVAWDVPTGTQLVVGRLDDVRFNLACSQNALLVFMLDTSARLERFVLDVQSICL